nr:hypothetical protein Iba_chr06bCG10830 [Ipomoea batatas]
MVQDGTHGLRQGVRKRVGDQPGPLGIFAPGWLGRPTLFLGCFVFPTPPLLLFLHLLNHFRLYKPRCLVHQHDIGFGKVLDEIPVKRVGPQVFLKIIMVALSSKLVTPNTSHFHLLRNLGREFELLCFMRCLLDGGPPRRGSGAGGGGRARPHITAHSLVKARFSQVACPTALRGRVRSGSAVPITPFCLGVLRGVTGSPICLVVGQLIDKGFKVSVCKRPMVLESKMRKAKMLFQNNARINGIKRLNLGSFHHALVLITYAKRNSGERSSRSPEGPRWQIVVALSNMENKSGNLFPETARKSNT